jgi:hypothetical protein
MQDHTINTSLPNNINQIIEAIVHNTAIAVVDGSFSPRQKLGTACWILCTSNTTTARVKGWGQTPGSITDMDAYRAEVHGIYSLPLLIKIQCNYYKITTGSIEISCDCLSALNQCLSSTIPQKSTQHDFDLIRAIYDIRQLLPITIKPRHVYGHQDDKNITLSKWERLNCE